MWLDKYKYSVVEVAQKLHGIFTGSGGEYFDEIQMVEEFEWLLRRVKEWELGLQKAAAYEVAMHLMCIGALHETTEMYKESCMHLRGSVKKDIWS